MLPKKTIQDVLHTQAIVSDQMVDAIRLWSDMYTGQSPWLKDVYGEERVVSLGLPALIASEKARMVTLEMKSSITAPSKKTEKKDDGLNTNGAPGTQPNVGTDTTETTEVEEGKSARADFLNTQYKKLLRQIRRQLEYGVAKGGLVIKPYIVKYEEPELGDDEHTMQDKLPQFEIEFDFVQADRFYPLSFDSNGKVIEAAFVQTKVDKAVNKIYTRVEYHKLTGRTVTVKNLAFESNNINIANTQDFYKMVDLGSPISLSAVPEWKDFSETVTIKNVDRLLFAYFRMPEANTIDPYSPLGVSGYSRVVSLIKDADEQYSRLLWEFEGSELAIDVDRDALTFRKGPDGQTILPRKQERLFRKVDLNAEDTYNVFSPAIRDQSLSHGLNIILMRIEDATGLSRGTLSEVNESDAKTATELKILKQRSYATNADIQAALQDALEDTVYIMNIYATLYKAAPKGDYSVSFEWDDSIIIDSESELSKRITLMQNKLSSRVEVRMWYFGETEEQARLAIEKLDEENRQLMIADAEANAAVAAETEPNTTGTDPNGKVPNNKDHRSTGTQADVLENPDKSKTVDNIKNKK